VPSQLRAVVPVQIGPVDGIEVARIGADGSVRLDEVVSGGGPAVRTLSITWAPRGDQRLCRLAQGVDWKCRTCGPI
jgi:hypothetical protein